MPGRGARLAACLAVCATVAATFSGCDRLVFGVKAREARVLDAVRPLAERWNARSHRGPVRVGGQQDVLQSDIGHAFIARRWISAPLLQSEFFEVKVPGRVGTTPDTLTYLAALDQRAQPVLLGFAASPHLGASDHSPPILNIGYDAEGPSAALIRGEHMYVQTTPINAMIARENVAPVDASEAVLLARFCVELVSVALHKSDDGPSPALLSVEEDNDGYHARFASYAVDRAGRAMDWVITVSREGWTVVGADASRTVLGHEDRPGGPTIP